MARKIQINCEKNEKKPQKNEKNPEKSQKKIKKSPKNKKKIIKGLKNPKKSHKNKKPKTKWISLFILTIILGNLLCHEKGLRSHLIQDDPDFSHNTCHRKVSGISRIEDEMKTRKITEWKAHFESGHTFSHKSGDVVTWGSTKGWLTNLQRNKRIKSQNGNIMNSQVLKIFHWNKGSSWWEKKIPEIESLIEMKKPDLLFISEANMKVGISEHLKVFEGYTTVHPKTASRYGYSRLVLFIREEIDFLLLDPLMTDHEASIWVKILIKGRRPICIGGNYREHRLLLQQMPNNTGTPALQQRRWNKTVNSWSAAAAQNSRCFFIGDLNLDFSRWQNPEAGHTRMVERVKTEMETQGFCQVIRGMTRFWPGQQDSQVDQCWTNVPGLVLSHSNEVWSSSDHNLIGVMLRTKERAENSQEITGRDWKSMDVARYRESVKDIDWSEFYSSNDINVKNSIFTEKLRTILDREAPMRVRQQRRNYACWLDANMKEMKRDRDEAREVARRSKDENDWRSYRHKRNTYNKELTRTKNLYYKEQYVQFGKEKDAKNIYKQTKKTTKI